MRFISIAILFFALLLCSFMYNYNSNITYIDKQTDAIVSPMPIVSQEISEELEDDIYFPTYEEIYSLDLTQPSGLTSEQLEKGLLKDLQQYAWKYIEMEEKYGINAVFLASKDALESGWGIYAYNNNLSGWGYFPFDTKEECIEHVSLYIKLWYLTESHDKSDCTDECIEYYNVNNQCTIGQYNYGLTVNGVNTKYNGRQFWEDEVIGIMVGIYSRIEDDELTFI